MSAPAARLTPEERIAWHTEVAVLALLTRIRDQLPKRDHLETCAACGCLCRADEVCPNCHPPHGRRDRDLPCAAWDSCPNPAHSHKGLVA